VIARCKGWYWPPGTSFVFWLVGSSLTRCSSNKIFSAGLDITEMHNPDPKRLGEFWSSVQQMYMDMYGSRLATVAAISGHSPAGGCIVSICCDYRIMIQDDSFKIGLNETQLGIRAPYWLADMYGQTIGTRQSEMHLALGTLFSPSKAHAVGLVDELSTNVRERAQDEAAKWAKIPASGRYATKQMVRQRFIDELLRRRQEDIDDFVNFVLRDDIQASIDGYLKALKKK